MALNPLESNPEVMTKFIHKLGVSPKWNIVDVYGLDDDALAWIPRPAVAFMLLFPCNDDASEKDGSAELSENQVIVPDLYFIKQYVSNACGTIALIHSVANNTDKIELNEGTFKNLFESSKTLSPEERGKLLLDVSNNLIGEDLIQAHQELAQEGQTKLNPDQPVNHHFVAFVEKDGYLYELDGRKNQPVNHGKTSLETFVKDAAKVCQAFMARNSNDINFTILALVQAD